MTTWADLITGAYSEIRVARAGDVLAPELMATAFLFAVLGLLVHLLLGA